MCLVVTLFFFKAIYTKDKNYNDYYKVLNIN